MSPVNPVAPYKPSNFTAQTAADYKNTIDSNSVAAQRIVTRFAPHAAAAPNMTVVVDAGSLFDGTNLTEFAPQATAPISAPVNYSRIDRVVLDNATGAPIVVTGQEATSPVPPAIPNGKSPIAQVTLTVGMSAITNSAISDERNFGSLAAPGFGAQSPIASANICDLSLAPSRNVLITGTTTVYYFAGSANTQSPIYLVEFAASLTLKNNPYTLLPGGADIQTAAGDSAIAEYLGNGYWRVRSYHRADGSTAVGAGFGVQTSLASAGTVDLSVAPSRNVLITGTTTTYYFAGAANLQSPIYLVEFSDSLTLKNSQYTLLPGGVDIQTAAGDTAVLEYLGGIGYWRVRSYHRADGSPTLSISGLLDEINNVVGAMLYRGPNGWRALAPPAADGYWIQQINGIPTWSPLPVISGAMVVLSTQDASNSGALNFTNIDSTYDDYVFEFSDIVGTGNFYVRFSNDGGSSWLGAANSYYVSYLNTAANYTNSLSYGYIFGNGVYPISGTMKLLTPANSSKPKKASLSASAGSASNFNATNGALLQAGTAAVNAVQFAMTTGSITSGRITMYGIKHA